MWSCNITISRAKIIIILLFIYIYLYNYCYYKLCYLFIKIYQNFVFIYLTLYFSTYYTYFIFICIFIFYYDRFKAHLRKSIGPETVRCFLHPVIISTEKVLEIVFVMNCVFSRIIGYFSSEFCVIFTDIIGGFITRIIQ